MIQSGKESGRSMIEILGMLAIAGILSIGAIAAYQVAMDKHRATTIIHEAHKRAVVAAGHINLHGKAPSLAGFASQNTTAGGTFGDVTQEGLNQQFGIELSHVKRSVCHQVLNAIGPVTPLRRLSLAEQPKVPLATCGEDNTFLMIYNNDLSANDPEETTGTICALNEELSTGCTCPAHRSQEDGKCGDCEQGDVSPWTQPTLSSDDDYGNLYSSASEMDEECNANSHATWCAFDGSSSTTWLSTEQQHSIMWALPNPLKISEIKFYNTNNANLFPSSIQIFASQDGDSWDIIAQASGYTKPSSSGYKIVSIDSQYANNPYMFVGFQFEQTGEESVALSEIKITADTFARKIYALDSNLECQETHICEENEPLSTGCRCSEDRVVEDGKCAGCKSLIVWRKWSRTTLTSNTSYGTLSSSAPIAGTNPSADRCDSTSHPAWCAINNSYGGASKWLVNTGAAHLIWALPTQLKVSKVSIYNSDEMDVLNRFPSTVVVYGSNNGTIWDVLGTASGYTKPGKTGHIDITCDNSVPYSQFKFEFTNTDVDALNIAELWMTAEYPRTITPWLDESLECQFFF